MKFIRTSYFTRIALYLVFSYWTAYFYIDYAGDWVVYGNGLLTFNPKIYQIEIPLFVILSLFFFFPSLNNTILRNLLPIVPSLILYFLFDAFYNFFGRVATPSDFENLLDIFSFSISLGIGLVSIYLLIPVSVYLSIKLNTRFNFSQLTVSLVMRLALLSLFVFTMTTQTTKTFQDKFFNYTVWAQEDTVRENGRINSAVFYALQELNYSQTLKQYSNQQNNEINIKKQLYPGQIQAPKNIHIVVMESFIDPRLIKELILPDSVVSKDLLKYLDQQQNFSRVISPIYGGGTAQAEFELLTGIKALGKVNKIEFNTMQGNGINAFLHALSLNDYFTNAMIAPSSEFFNSKRAYKSLGFNEVDFLQEGSVVKNVMNSDVLFDGDLFDLNIRFLEKHFEKNDKPILNYVLGMYGHMPFDRNTKLRPDVISPNHSDDRLNRIVNQFYYRTNALASYLKKLIEIDPTSVIFITSDHLPSVMSKDAHYQLDNKINIALFINNGKAIDVSGKYFYQIPWLIWDIISEKSDKKALKRHINEQQMEVLYFIALSESLQK